MARKRTALKTAEIVAEKTAENAPNRFYFLATIGAIAISALFFISGRRNWAMFFGQWPPTILALGLMSKLLHPSKS
jgi:hypothetical protein